MAKGKWIKALIIINTIAFIIMVAANALADTIPINGVTTAQVSAAYPNLFTPAGITFAIWGLIYLLLAIFVKYQFGALKKKNQNRENVVKNIGIFFAISSFANAAWIFAWHYFSITASLILMIIILLSLLIAYTEINNTGLSKKELLLVRVPFSVYFGWITIALIANITVWLVSIGWSGLGISQQLWTIIAISLGVIICVAVMLAYSDTAYGAAVLWGYIGILIKQLSQNDFGGQYTSIIIADIIAIAIIVGVIICIEHKRKAYNKVYA